MVVGSTPKKKQTRNIANMKIGHLNIDKPEEQRVKLLAAPVKLNMSGCCLWPNIDGWDKYDKWDNDPMILPGQDNLKYFKVLAAGIIQTTHDELNEADAIKFKIRHIIKN